MDVFLPVRETKCDDSFFSRLYTTKFGIGQQHFKEERTLVIENSKLIQTIHLYCSLSVCY
jgi:hypothetical protein